MENYKKYVERLQLQLLLVLLGNLLGKRERGPLDVILIFHLTSRGKTSTLVFMKFRDFCVFQRFFDIFEANFIISVNCG